MYKVNSYLTGTVLVHIEHTEGNKVSDFATNALSMHPHGISCDKILWREFGLFSGVNRFVGIGQGLQIPSEQIKSIIITTKDDDFDTLYNDVCKELAEKIAKQKEDQAINVTINIEKITSNDGQKILVAITDALKKHGGKIL